MTEYGESKALASTDWAVEHLGDSRVKYVEVIWGDSDSFGSAAFARAHIPGAVSWDFGREVRKAGGDIADRIEMEALLNRSGIGPGDTVVVYSGLNNMLATYVFWLLRVYGHERLLLLDGDRQKWLDEKRPVSSHVDAPEVSTYQLGEPNLNLRANREDVLAAIGQADHLLVDARSAAMYSGADKAGARRGGHIPGAINYTAIEETRPDGSFVAWRVPAVKADGTFKSDEELREFMIRLGITPDKQIITYCVRGGLSTHAWFVLTQLLGYPDVREYDRSWAEWGNQEELPIAP